MGKKVIIIVLAFVLVVLLAVGGYLLINQNDQSNEGSNNSNTNNNENSDDNSNITSESNILVVYFSATGNTSDIALKIADNLDADIFEIVPVDEYSSADLNYNDDNSRVSIEHADEDLRTVELVQSSVDNWDQYDIVIIGYPIWWGIAAWPVSSFVAMNDFTGKTVVPFCTSASSGVGQSAELLSNAAGSGNWLSGTRFSSSVSDNAIKEFSDSIIN